MAKILLHIGTPKTGSTSLQDLFFYSMHQKKIINYLGKINYSFRINKNNKKGVLRYETYKKIKKAVFLKENFTTNDLKKYRKQINLVIDKNKINVISEENFFVKDKICNFIPFLERIKRMQLLLQGHSVSVLCVLRRQPEYLFSYYIQNYNNGWYFVKNNNIAKYYKNILSNAQARKETLYYADNLKQYKKTFGNIHCLFFEELLENEFSYYQKIATLLNLKITQKDIPIQKENVKQKTKKGYTTYRNWDLKDILTTNKSLPIIHYKIYKSLFLIKISNLLPRILRRLFLRYNIFLNLSQKQKIYSKIRRIILNFFDKATLHPYFTNEQKQTILKLCREANQELAEEKFCTLQDLKKYGYL